MKSTTAFPRPRARIMLVDDHPLVRRGLCELIADEPNLEVCAEAADAEQALKLVHASQPDLIIIDIALQGISGIDLIKRVKSRHQDVKMLVSSMYEETLYAERALRAGAMGYVNKGEAPDKVIAAIHSVLEGKIFLSQEMTNRLLHGVVRGEAIGPSAVETLTDRELQVFQLIGRGLTTREIATKLHLSIKTIETYREHLKAKLKLTTAAELTRHAVRWVLENG